MQSSPSSPTLPASTSDLCLASASPRRLELLRQLGFTTRVQPADVDETHHPGESPQAYVCRIAKAKVDAIQATDPKSLVVGADTTVVCNGEILGKPTDAADAQRMLSTLAGRPHQVWTGVCVGRGKEQRSCEVMSEVVFRPLSSQEIAAYVATGEPMDKAGAYAIQGRGAVFVTRLEGSYSGVMGLPLCELAALLAQFGVTPWQA